MAPSVFPFMRPVRPGEMVKASATFSAFPFDVATLMDTARKNAQSFATAQQLFLESLQVIAHRQGALTAELVDGMAELARTFTQAEAPEDKMADQALILKHFYERTEAHMNEIQDMIHQSGRETRGVMQRRMGHTLAELKDAIDRAKHKHAA